ncbi:MAG: hypothetical protein J6X38_07830 [Abditibacteriota bacterium]|nr:hypothetical protein [Abditibacteriota bacterium]
MKYPVLALILALLTAPAFADLPADAALDQKVEFSSAGEPLWEVFDKLSAVASVNLFCGKDENDWVVRDRKIIIASRSMSLREIMNLTADICDFAWMKEAKGYRLLQTPEQAAAEAKQRTDAGNKTAAQKALEVRRTKALEDTAALKNAPNKDALKKSAPWQYLLATTPLGEDAAAFINEYEPAKKAFTEGKSLSFPVTDLSAPLSARVERIVKCYDNIERTLNASDEAETDMFVGAKRIYIHINPERITADDADAQGLMGKISVTCKNETVEIPIYEPGSKVANAIGKGILAMEAGESAPKVAKELSDELTSVAARAAKRNLASVPTGGIFDAKLTLSPTDKQIPAATVLYQLSKAANVNVISDYYPMIVPVMEGGELTAGRVTALFDALYGKTHELKGATLVFKSTDRAVKRAWEVPGVWMNYWLSNGRYNGGLGIGDFIQIAGLRDEQLDNTVASDIDLMRMGAGEAIKNRNLLRFMLNLSDDEMKALCNLKLAVNKLDKDKIELLRRALADYDAMLPAEITDKEYALLTSENINNDTIKYIFAYHDMTGEKPAATVEMIQGIAFKTKDEVPEGIKPENRN